MASWVKQVSKIEKICNEEILNKAVELYEKYGRGFSVATDIYNEIELVARFEKFENEEERYIYVRNRKIEADNMTLNFYDKSEEMIKEIQDFQKHLNDIFIQNNYNFRNQRDIQIFSFRYLNFLNKSSESLYLLIKDARNTNIDVKEEVSELFWELKWKRRKKIWELKNQKRDNEEYKKIFDYKEMVRLAEENGYQHRRTTGDHMILQHNESQKIVVIPAHELGYGLMLEIQKQIKENKIA